MSYSYGSLHLFFICLAKSFKDYHESRVNGPIMHLISALHRAPSLLKCAPSPDLYLASSIVLETACTLCLPKSNENKLWFVPIYMGYGTSFYMFPKCLDKYSLNIAYTIWSGVGIVFTYLVDLGLKRDVFTFKKILGIFTILSGMLMVK